MKAIRIHRTGGPEVLQVEDLAIPEPGPGEILIRHEAIGLNFIDTYHRSGLYPVELPAIPGLDGWRRCPMALTRRRPRRPC